jgi:hypothetical protein
MAAADADTHDAECSTGPFPRSLRQAVAEIIDVFAIGAWPVKAGPLALARAMRSWPAPVSAGFDLRLRPRRVPVIGQQRAGFRPGLSSKSRRGDHPLP